jgi:hypothetical protein
MVNARRREANIRICPTAKKCWNFSVEAARATVLSSAIRASNGLASVGASSTAVAVRDGVGRL